MESMSQSFIEKVKRIDIRCFVLIGGQRIIAHVPPIKETGHRIQLKSAFVISEIEDEEEGFYYDLEPLVPFSENEICYVYTNQVAFESEVGDTLRFMYVTNLMEINSNKIKNESPSEEFKFSDSIRLN